MWFAQQSITSAERSVLELYVDMELLHRDSIEHSVTKVLTFVDFQKLKAAKRVDRFYREHPALAKGRQSRSDHVEVLIRWSGYRGWYSLHCHNLEHEDHSMMARVDVI